MKLDVDDLLKRLTLEEKASLCSGLDFWNTNAIERLGIPSWMMTDGPHGLRKQASGHDATVTGSVPATCFPTGVGLAASWNPELLRSVGQAIGREARGHGVGVVLGPAVNIKRSPLCGRNFEYLSEDPYLAGELAKAHINGLQGEGVGASVKHFAVNNQEHLRMTIDARVDERTLREIYLPAFEAAVKGAQPWTVMCSYNRINGTYASESRWLLNDLLKDEWGHTGMVVTDWGANNDRVKGLVAGQDFEMPGNGLTDADIVRAVNEGRLDVEILDRTVRRILTVTQRVMDHQGPGVAFTAEDHHVLARRVATETMVLLKNKGGLLPLAEGETIAFLGAFAREPRYQGAGSSHIHPTRMDDAVEEARRTAPGTEVVYAPGYRTQEKTPDQGLIDEAVALAARASVAVVFVGLTDAFESEGFDRTHLGLPEAHNALVEAVLRVQPRVVVVLSNGAPVSLPWVDRVPAILESYLGGQGWGGAVVDLLFGKANPSGKLAETFPLRLEDTPCFLNFPGDGHAVDYREGVFVGYRHYDALGLAPLFPFGHGLSYATFGYGPLVADQSEIAEHGSVTLSLEVTNTGSVAGAEVVQLYVEAPESKVVRPVRELRAFAKVGLAPGETRRVSLRLERRAFATWNAELHAWVVEDGTFEVVAGSSSRDLRARTKVKVHATAPARSYDQNTTLGELRDHPSVGGFVTRLLEAMLGLFGHYEPGSAEATMMETMVSEMPLRNVVRMSGGQTPPELLETLLEVLGGKRPVSDLARFTPS